jgi:hypothetical protein
VVRAMSTRPTGPWVSMRRNTATDAGELTGMRSRSVTL